MSKQTLMSLFEDNRQELEEQLKGLILPKDSFKIQRIVSDYFNKMFDSDNDFRQNLTQAEDYILQAALSLLNAQQAIGKEIINVQEMQLQKDLKEASSTISHGLKKEMYPHTNASPLLFKLY